MCQEHLTDLTVNAGWHHPEGDSHHDCGRRDLRYQCNNRICIHKAMM